MHEVGPVFFDLEAGPSIAGVLDHAAIFFIMITTAADNTRLAGFSTLLALLFSLAVSLSVDTALAISEVYSDLQIRRDRAIHPWVCKDLFDCRPLRRFQGHHFFEEIGFHPNSNIVRVP